MKADLEKIEIELENLQDFYDREISRTRMIEEKIKKMANIGDYGRVLANARALQECRDYAKEYREKRDYLKSFLID
jgi:hypothetical protein